MVLLATSPRLPAVLVTKTENLLWANGLGQELNRHETSWPRRADAGGGGQNTSAACAGGGILLRLQGLGTFRELRALSTTTASGQVKGERQQGALTAASGTSTCRNLQVEGGTFKTIRSCPKGRGPRTVRAGQDRRAPGSQTTSGRSSSVRDEPEPQCKALRERSDRCGSELTGLGSETGWGLGRRLCRQSAGEEGLGDGEKREGLLQNTESPSMHQVAVDREWEWDGVR